MGPLLELLKVLGVPLVTLLLPLLVLTHEASLLTLSRTVNEPALLPALTMDELSIFGVFIEAIFLLLFTLAFFSSPS